MIANVEAAFQLSSAFVPGMTERGAFAGGVPG